LSRSVGKAAALDGLWERRARRDSHFDSHVATCPSLPQFTSIVYRLPSAVCRLPSSASEFNRAGAGSERVEFDAGIAIAEFAVHFGAGAILIFDLG